MIVGQRFFWNVSEAFVLAESYEGILQSISLKTTTIKETKHPQNMAKEDIHISLQRLTAVENSTMGLISAVIEMSMNQWMLYCKNATQQGLKLTLNPRILYRGFGVSVTNIGILTAIQFPSTNYVNGLLTGGEKRKLTDAEMIFAGFCGGAISGVVCGPMEFVMIQQQRFGGNLFNTPSRLTKSFGVSAFGRGMTTSVLREAVFTAGYMGLLPAVQRKLEKDNYSVHASKILAGIFSGVLSGTLSHPLDTIKTCMQGDIERKKYGSIRETAQRLYNKEGIGAFFRGYAWRTSRIIYGTLIYSECRTRLSPIFFPHILTDE